MLGHLGSGLGAAQVHPSLPAGNDIQQTTCMHRILLAAESKPKPHPQYPQGAIAVCLLTLFCLISPLRPRGPASRLTFSTSEERPRNYESAHHPLRQSFWCELLPVSLLLLPQYSIFTLSLTFLPVQKAPCPGRGSLTSGHGLSNTLGSANRGSALPLSASCTSVSPVASYAGHP